MLQYRFDIPFHAGIHFIRANKLSFAIASVILLEEPYRGLAVPYKNVSSKLKAQSLHVRKNCVHLYKGWHFCRNFIKSAVFALEFGKALRFCPGKNEIRLKLVFHCNAAGMKRKTLLKKRLFKTFVVRNAEAKIIKIRAEGIFKTRYICPYFWLRSTFCKAFAIEAELKVSDIDFS